MRLLPQGLLCLSLTLLGSATAWAQSDLIVGEAIFKARCVICHGVNADGRSDLARIMRPPPANLRTSQLSEVERNRIVSKGGEAVGRSSNMPIWEQELSEDDLRAVVAYVGTLQSSNTARHP
jgi:mono/diheme cytochrome c family protein